MTHALFAMLALAAASDVSSSLAHRAVFISQECRTDTPVGQRELITTLPSVVAMLGKSKCQVKNTSVQMDVVSVSVGTYDYGDAAMGTDAAVRIIFTKESAKRFDDLQSENVGRKLVISVKQFAVIDFEVRRVKHSDSVILNVMDVSAARAIRSALDGAKSPIHETGAK